ncbi:HAD-IA family hydrolase [Leifsonia sp. Leaf264]|uniref:HAD-IA family hydrolase n=1 Tax=Leifsonia sp. Leaf264 TaxID=1736314 RepID=UPI0006FC7D22|nr:HAD-IA family hydrolase [Leifsonia sp. Leaf264]KQO99532.1 hydrolase [Leifsonia sp. Leaf264]
MVRDVYFFDCDKTLYDYDFRRRLPCLADLTGVSQYHLADSWWAGGFEEAAERGEITTTEEYLAAFAEVTGADLSLGQWQEARAAAMTRIDGSLDALRLAAELGTASLLSNNPIIFKDSLGVLAADVAEVVGSNDLVSAVLGARKPERRIYTRAMGRLGVLPEHAFFVDDSAANVAGAREAGMTAFQLVPTRSGHNTDELAAAIREFSERDR